MQKVISLDPDLRMDVTELYGIVKDFGATRVRKALVRAEEENKALRVMDGKLDGLKTELNVISAKLDPVLDELKKRFDALDSSALCLEVILREDIQLGKAQAGLLPDMIESTKDALDRVLSAAAQMEIQQSSAASADELQRCMTTATAEIRASISSMETRIEATVSSALAAQRTEDAEEFCALVDGLKVDFKALTTDVQTKLHKLSNSSADVADKVKAWEKTMKCLETGLRNVHVSFSSVDFNLKDLKNGQVEADLMLRTLIEATHDIPTDVTILPHEAALKMDKEVDEKNAIEAKKIAEERAKEAKGKGIRGGIGRALMKVYNGLKSAATTAEDTKEALEDAGKSVAYVRYRLYFLCSHTHVPAPCGPEGKGYEIIVPREWLIEAAPVLRVGLGLLKLAVMATGVPVPMPNLPEGLEEGAKLAEWLEKLRAALGDVDGDKQKAHAIIKYLLLDGVDIRSTCGLSQATHRGITTWVLKSEIQNWKDAQDKEAQQQHAAAPVSGVKAGAVP